MMKQLNGAQIVLECLKEQGVDTVFGYPGGAILNIYDELYKQSEKSHISLLLMSRELLMQQTDMQEQQEKSECVLQPVDREQQISSQDLQQRYMDSVPVVAITCNVGVSLLGKDSFQEVDISGVTMPSHKA